MTTKLLAAVQLRPAAAADLGVINEIYNHYVLHSTATYQEAPETADARRAWFEHHGPAHPVVVAEVAREVVAWGSLSPFHPRSAYRRTVEDSIYVHPAWQRRGIGRAILADLITRARAAEHHTIIALIDAAQTGSLALHAAFGFEPAGNLKQVGHKHGQWLDVAYMQLLL